MPDGLLSPRQGKKEMMRSLDFSAGRAAGWPAFDWALTLKNIVPFDFGA